MDFQTRIIFYKAYIQPHLDYCCIIWGNAKVEQLNVLLKLQKRVLRIIFDYPDISSQTLFSQASIMPITKRIYFQKAVLMYKALHNLTPSYISEEFQLCSDIHSYSSKSSTHNVFIHRPRTELLKSSFKYSGAVIWNSLSQDMKSAQTLKQFKNLLLHNLDLFQV